MSAPKLIRGYDFGITVATVAPYRTRVIGVADLLEVRLDARVVGVQYLGGDMFQVVLEVADRARPEPLRLTFSMASDLLAPWPGSTPPPALLAQALRGILDEVLAHEVDEAITLGGERPFDPHADLPPGTLRRRTFHR